MELLIRPGKSQLHYSDLPSTLDGQPTRINHPCSAAEVYEPLEIRFRKTRMASITEASDNHNHEGLSYVKIIVGVSNRP